MLVEIAAGIFAITVVLFLKCPIISPWILCNVVQNIKQRNSAEATIININNNVPKKKKKSDFHKKKNKSRDSHREKATKQDVTPHSQSSAVTDLKASLFHVADNKLNVTKGATRLESNNKEEKAAKVSLPISGNTAVEEPPLSIAVHPPNNLQKLDQDAQNRKIFASEKATESFTFTLDRYGGVVESPFCRLFFPYQAVSRAISITVEPKYRWMNFTENGKFFMTPEVYFTSADEMKFQRPVEVQLRTPYSATNKKDPVAVEIERTEHCIPQNWLKIRDVKFHKGMIKFLCNQFCGIRAVCNSCQRQIMSTRLSYSLSVQDSLNLPNWKKMIYFRVFTDTPNTNEQIRLEMEQDGYRRIHPSQYFNLKNGYNLMVKLDSRGLETSPAFDIVQIDAEVISQACIFTLYSENQNPITDSSIAINADLAEISLFKTSRVHYETNPVRREPRNVNITVNSGIGIQNINTLERASHESNSLSAVSPTQPIINLRQPLQHLDPQQQEIPFVAQQPSFHPLQSIDVNPTPNRPERVFTRAEVNETKPMGTWMTQNHPPDSHTHNSHAITTVSNETMVTSIQEGQNSYPMYPHEIERPHSQDVLSLTEEANSTNTGQPYATISPRPDIPSHGNHRFVTNPTMISPFQIQATSNAVTKSNVGIPLQSITDTNIQPHKRSSSLHHLEQTQQKKKPLKKQRSISTSENDINLTTEQSHPTYTQTIQRSAFKSAFSSYPLLLKNLWSQVSINSTEKDSEKKENRQEVSLAMLEEDDQHMLNPVNGNGEDCDELFEYLGETSAPEEALGNQAWASISNQAESTTSGHIPERPSAISSGFCSGISTRNTSVNAEPIFSPIDKHLSEIEELKDVIPVMPRPRSISDPPKSTNITLKKSQPALEEVDQPPQTKHKKSYSEVVKIQNKGHQSTPRSATKISPNSNKIKKFSPRKRVPVHPPWIP
uniref:uncharacterized protein LOC120344439 n=1 Tax=Styela clava TaxID=7725 RepID=UPI0019396734|nr:uncharacterized protein LOC120344439 [Styela clava]